MRAKRLKKGCHDPSFYLPNVNSIRITRRLHALEQAHQADPESMPNLLTHKDYMKYFARFSPQMLRQIFTNLNAIELTKGCNAPCRTMCLFPVRGVVRDDSPQIPFETLEWIFQNYGDVVKEKWVTLYHGSDMKYYRHTDTEGRTHDAVDVILLYGKTFGHLPFISISFGLDQWTIKFIVRCLQKGIEIDRISRLASGKTQEECDRLIGKVAEKREIRIKEIEMLRQALGMGEKESIEPKDFIVGNAINEDMEEQNMGTAQFACQHGVTLKAGEGFKGIIMRPPSRVFPHSTQEFPIRASKEGTIVLPQKEVRTGRFYLPFSFRDDYIPAPIFLTFTGEGVLLKTEGDDGHLDGMREIGQQLKFELLRTEKRNRHSRDFFADARHYLEQRRSKGPEPDSEKAARAMSTLSQNVNQYLEWLKTLTGNRLRLCQKYADDPDLLSDIDSLNFSLAESTMESVEEISGMHYRLNKPYRFVLGRERKRNCDYTVLWDPDTELINQIHQNIKEANAILDAHQEVMRNAINKQIRDALGELNLFKVLGEKRYLLWGDRRLTTRAVRWVIGA